jgi:membrane protein YqaA with SNARE-associated domain
MAQDEVPLDIECPRRKTGEGGRGGKHLRSARYNRQSPLRHTPRTDIYLVRSFIAWLYTAALGLGGPGLLVVAFIDSSFIPLPQINDVLVVLMVTQNKAWMPYYAAMATLGSILGCYVIYYIAEKGGEAFLQKRFRKRGPLDRTLALYRRWGLLALVVPALLPPPAPFKLFVLAAGVAGIRPVQFVTAIALARGARYLALGTLAIYYGDAALELMRTRGRDVALWIVFLIVLAAVVWWLLKRRRRDA